MATRKSTFLLKRSNVPGKIPVLSGLTLGEVGLNVADAKLYTLYTGGSSGATEVREIGWNRLSISGGTITGDLNVTGSISATTYYGNGQYLTGLVTNDFYVTGGTFSGNTLILNRQNGSVTITGFTSGISGDYLPISGGTIYGNLTVTGNTIVNTITATTLSASTIFTQIPNTQVVFSNNGTLTGSTNLTWINSASTLSVSGTVYSTIISGNTIYATNYPDLPYVDGQTIEMYSDSTGTTYVRLKEIISAPTGGTRTFLGNINISSGLTVTGNTILRSGLTASTISISSTPTISTTNTQFLTRNSSTGNIEYNNFTSISTGDTYVTGFTYGNNNVTISQNLGQNPLTINISTMTGLTVNGSLSATTFNGSGSGLLNIPISGVTNLQTSLNNKYDKSGGTISGNVLINGNLNVTGDTILSTVTATTLSASTIFTQIPNTQIVFSNNGILSGSTNLTLINSGSTLNISGNLIVSGNTNLTALSATTIHANDYPDLPYVDGQTIEVYTDVSGTTFIRLKEIVSAPTGGTRTFLGNINITSGLTVTGNTILRSGLTASTLNISTTPTLSTSNTQFLTRNSTTGNVEYSNFSSVSTGDTYVTGFTYLNNNITLSQNLGQSPLSVNISTMTGLTVNGSLSATTFNGSGSGLLNIPISGITNLQTNLDNKYDKSGGTISGNVTITGNLIVNGTATTINTETLLVKDNIITLNSNYSGNTTPYNGNSGIEVLRGSGTTSTLLWDESNNYWVAGLSGSTKRIILSGDSLSLLNSGHTHTISDINDLQTSLNNKFDISGGTINGNLTVTGDTTINGTLSATTFYGTNLGTSGNCFTDLFISNINSCSPLYIQNKSIGDILIGGNNNVNLGINTLNPLSKVDIRVNSGTTGVIMSGNTSSEMLRITQLGSGNAITIEDSENPDATPFVIDSTGRIGIGTPTPNYFMEAVSNGGTDAIMLFDGGTSANANLIARADTTIKVPSLVITDRNDSYNINNSFFIALDRASGVTSNLYANRNDAIYINNYQDKGHYFITNNSGSKGVRFSISSNGNVGIGVMSASTKLQVSGDTLINGGLTASTLNLSSTPTISTSNTQFLTRNTSTGNIEYNNFTSISTGDTYVTGFTYSNNNLTLLRNQGQSALTVNISTMSGLTINGNLTVTGSTLLNTLTANTVLFSSSTTNTLTVVGSGSSTSSPIFSVQGSSGELFSVSDSLTGSLFSVNDISGLPILEVFSNNEILMGSYLAPSLNTTVKTTLTAGTNHIYSIPTSAYTGAFFDYTVLSSTGARAGNIMSIFSGTSVQYTDVSTNDIGTTSGVTFSMDINSGFARLSSSATTSGWTLKTIVRGI